MINSELADNGKITSKRSLGNQSFRQGQNDQATVENFNVDSSTENVILNYVEYVTFAGDDNVTTSSNNSTYNEEISETILAMEVKKIPH